MGTDRTSYGNSGPILRLIRGEIDPELGLSRSRGLHPSARKPVTGPVLYVSSDQTSRILFTRIARRWTRMTLLIAQGGEAGLKLAVDRRPRLVVLEGELPDVDCETTIIRLRHRTATSQVPILVLSSDHSPITRVRLLLAGASAYTTKPLDVAKVDRMVADLLETQSLPSRLPSNQCSSAGRARAVSNRRREFTKS